MPHFPTPSEEFIHELEGQSRRKKYIDWTLLAACVIAVLIGAYLLFAGATSVSCTGQQTIMVRAGDTLNGLMVDHINGIMDDSVSSEEVRYLIEIEEPELKNTIYPGDLITLPQSCTGDGITSSWKRNGS